MAEGTEGSERESFTFRWEAPVHEVFPSLHEAQSAWLAQVDSLSAPDRRTTELIRMACSVAARNPAGVSRHAMLAREVGASWEDIVGSIMLTTPAFGILAAVEALPHAKRGFDEAPEVETDDNGDS
jgi:alkylhydroperoxidase/carboxymuconolactone decarboxylase family protein YurZ